MKTEHITWKNRIFPLVGAIIVFVLALNIFTDGVQSYLDPSQRSMTSIKKFKRKLGIIRD